MILKETFRWSKNIGVPVTYECVFVNKHGKSGARTGKARNF